MSTGREPEIPRLGGWGARIRTWDHGTKARCLTAWLRPNSRSEICMPAPKPPAQSGPNSMGALSLRIWASGCPPTSIGAREQCAERPRRLGGRSDRGCRASMSWSWPKPRRNRLPHGSVSRACRMGGQPQGPGHILRHPGRVGQCLPIEHPEKILLGVEEDVPQATPSDNGAGMSGRIDPSRQCGGTSMVLGVRTEDSEGGSAPLSVSADL